MTALSCDTAESEILPSIAVFHINKKKKKKKKNQRSLQLMQNF